MRAGNTDSSSTRAKPPRSSSRNKAPTHRSNILRDSNTADKDKVNKATDPLIPTRKLRATVV